MDKRLNIEEFVARANYKHNGLYDYSQSNYIDYHSKIDIICSKHGLFQQRVKHHLSGSGCQKCSAELLSLRFLEKWSDDEILLLKEIYPINNLTFCAKKLKKCAPTVSKKNKRIRFNFPTRKKKG